MKKNILFKTNLKVVLILLVSFVLVALLGYQIHYFEAPTVWGVFFLIVGIIVAVMVTIISIIHKFDVGLTQRLEEQQSLFKQATETIYDNVYELNITQNRAANQRTEKYFETLGSTKLPYDESLQVVAQKQIKKEYRQGYVDTFSRANVLKQFTLGNNYLQYEFMITEDGKNFFWMRIEACIFYSPSDKSVHMFTYRKNIEEEKQKELEIRHQAATDEMTGIYTKAATERIIDKILKEELIGKYAFYIIDIDDFKQANDQHGHLFGDHCIQKLVTQMKAFCHKNDVIGRIGGDEFVVFGQVSTTFATERIATALCKALNKLYSIDDIAWQMTVSVGIAVAPNHGRDFASLYNNADKALYETKDNGKNGYTLYRVDM